MSVQNSERQQNPMSSPARRLGRHYGSYDGKTAYALENTAGAWQVKVFDPTNRRAVHDGWLLLGAHWPSLAAAQAATGLT